MSRMKNRNKGVKSNRGNKDNNKQDPRLHARPPKHIKGNI